MPAEHEKNAAEPNAAEPNSVENEPLAEARVAKAVEKDESRRNKKIAIGIGSAAIVAALLYAGRDKSKGGED